MAVRDGTSEQTVAETRILRLPRPPRHHACIQLVERHAARQRADGPARQSHEP